MAQQIAAFLYIWNSVSIWICFAYCYDFVYVDADMAKKGVDCVKIIQSFYAMMEDMIEKILSQSRRLPPSGGE